MLNKTIEEDTCFDVMNMHIKEAVNLIRERGLVDHVAWKDGKDFPKKILVMFHQESI